MINETGDVIGHSTSINAENESRGFFYSRGIMYDLQSIVSGLPSGIRALNAIDLNSTGQILARGCFNSAQCRTYLLDPVAHEHGHSPTR